MRSGSAWAVAVVVHLASAAPVAAQPWVPAPGEGTVSVTYQNYYVVGHFDVKGKPNRNGATHAKTLVAQLDVGLTETIAFRVTLPFIATKYTGPEEYLVAGIATHPGPLDDRRYHGAFQDVRLEARRLFDAGRVAFAPFVGASIPSHDYQTQGEAVPGRRRRELQVGVTAGADLTRVVRRTTVHASYALAAAERFHGFASVKSNLDVEGGFHLSPRIALRALAGWQFRHKGPTIASLAARGWDEHDRFIVAGYFNLGGGMSVSITRDTELSAIWVSTVSGHNGAHRARMLALGLSWSFGGGMDFGGFAAVNDERSRSIRQRAGP